MSESGYARNISHLHINCSDLKRSVEFYQLLGFTVDRILSDEPVTTGQVTDISKLPLMSSPDGQCACVGMGLSSDDPRAITRLELMEWKSRGDLDSTNLSNDYLGMVRMAFTVKNLDKLIESIQGHGYAVGDIGVTIISPALKSRHAYLRDPDNVWLTLMEWIKP